MREGNLRPAKSIPLRSTGTKSVEQRYLERSTRTLEAIAASVNRREPGGATIAESQAMLRKLVGIAACFGDAPLGEIASQIERELTDASPPAWNGILSKGWLALYKAD